MGVGTRTRRVAAVVVLVAAAAFLVSPTREAPPELHPFGTATRDRPGTAQGPPDVPRPPPAAPATRTDPQPARTVQDAFGAFVGNEGMDRVHRYEAALGLGPGETLGHVLRFAFGGGRGGWKAWRDSITEVLAQFSAPGQRRRLVLSLPLLVANPLPDDTPQLAAAGLREDPQTLEAGAAGAYDDQWRWLGEQLVLAYGRRLPTEVLLRPGWEANGSWFSWSYGTPGGYDAALAADFAGYWRRVHDLVTGPLRAAGTRVHWVLNGAGGSFGTGGFEAAWPGDEYVDVVSMDLYQNFAFRDPADFSAAAAALAWLEAVGAARRKLVAVDETSVAWRWQGGRQVGGGDNGLWFSSLRRWADRMVAERRLSHLLVFEADPAPTELFAPMFPRYPRTYTFPQARADLIASFGGAAR